MDLVFYDCTRLLSRFASDTPTGIDRVDIWHLKHLSDASASRRAVGVFQCAGSLILMKDPDVALLRESLWQVWIDGIAHTSRQKAMLSDLYRRTLGGKFQIINSKSKSSRPLLDPALINERMRERRRRAFYFNTSHHGTSNVAMFVSLRSMADIEPVFFVHDLIPCDFPEFVREGDDKAHAERIAAMATTASLLVVNSNYTAQRLSSFISRSELPLPPVIVNYIGVESRFLRDSGLAPSVSREPDRSYFVSIGTIEPRKNHLLLLNIWRRLALEGGEIPELILIGKRGWNNQSTFELLDRCPSIRAHVKEYSGLSDEAMHRLLCGSRALLFPSAAEGWGMPLAEALASGVPAVVSDLEVFRECSQGLALFVDSLDGAGWLQNIRELAKPDSSLGNQLREQSRLYMPPRWKDHFVRLDEAMAVLPRQRLFASRLSPDELRTRWSEYVQDRAVVHVRSGETTFPTLDRLMLRVLSGRSLKKYEKFKRNPVRFFKDSRFRGFRTIGNFLERGRTLN